VTGVAATGLTRVTVVAPQTRVDLSIPDDVPLADILPTLLRYVGADVAAAGVAHGGWALARLGGPALDTDRTPAQLGVKHGEELHFTPREAVAPEVVFDDVVDAIAGGVDRAGRRWAAGTTRCCGLAVLAGAALLGAALLALVAPAPHLPSGLAALGIGLVLLAVSAVLARAAGDAGAGLLAAALAAPYGFVAGLLLVAPDTGATGWGAAPLLTGAALLVLFLVLGAMAVAVAVPVFVGAGTAALALAVTALVVLLPGVRPASAAAVLATVTLAAVPMLPMLAFRLARLPVPTIPTTPDELKDDAVQVAGADVLARTLLAGEYLTALLAAASALVLGCVPVLIAGDRWTGWVLALVAAALLLCRSRTFEVLPHRLSPLLAGLAALGVLLVGGTLRSPAGDLPAGTRVAVAVAILVVIGAVAGTYGLAVAGRRITPVAGRVLDIVEVVLGLAVIPLALDVCGLYSMVRALNG
jgi:ESX secretion system protein EccD